MGAETDNQTLRHRWHGLTTLPRPGEGRGHFQAVVRLPEPDHQGTGREAIGPEGALPLRMGDIGFAEQSTDGVLGFPIEGPGDRCRRCRGRMDRPPNGQDRKPGRKGR